MAHPFRQPPFRAAVLATALLAACSPTPPTAQPAPGSGAGAESGSGAPTSAVGSGDEPGADDSATPGPGAGAGSGGPEPAPSPGTTPAPGSDGSGATAGSARGTVERNALRAQRPDALLRWVPADASAVALVDVATLRTMLEQSSLAPLLVDPEALGVAVADQLVQLLPEEAAGVLSQRVRFDLAPALGLATFGPGRSLLVLPVAAVVEPPGDLQPAAPLPGGLRIARRGDVVLLGDADAVAAGTTEPAGSDALATLWADRMPGDAERVALQLVVARWDALTEEDPREGSGMVAGLLGAAEPGNTSLALQTDGTLTLTTTVQQPDAVAMALGHGRTFANTALGQLQREAAPEAQPAVAWLNRAVELGFSRLRMAQDGSSVRLELAPPACGTWERNVSAALLIGGVVAAAAHDSGAPAIAWTNPEEPPTTQCAADAMAPAQLPAAMASLAEDVGPGEPAVLALVDLPGALRQGLPTGFGLLPAALTSDDLQGALGARPFGLDGLNDPDGGLAWWYRPMRSEFSLVMHGGSDRLWPATQPLAGVTMVSLSNGRRAWTTDVPGTEVRMRDDARSAFRDHAEMLPAESVAALVFTPALVDPVLTRAGDNALAVAMRDAQTIALALTPANGLELSLRAAGGFAADDATLLAAMPGLWLALGGPTVSGALTPARQQAMQALLARQAVALEIERSGSTITFRWPTAGWARTWMVGLTVGGPLFGGALQLPSLRGRFTTPTGPMRLDLPDDWLQRP